MGKDALRDFVFFAELFMYIDLLLRILFTNDKVQPTSSINSQQERNVLAHEMDWPSCSPSSLEQAGVVDVNRSIEQREQHTQTHSSGTASENRPRPLSGQSWSSDC